jgi:hypothetical protein
MPAPISFGSWQTAARLGSETDSPMQIAASMIRFIRYAPSIFCALLRQLICSASRRQIAGRHSNAIFLPFLECPIVSLFALCRTEARFRAVLTGSIFFVAPSTIGIKHRFRYPFTIANFRDPLSQ